MEDKKILYVALALVGGIMVGYMTGGLNISGQDQGAAALVSQTASEANRISNSQITPVTGGTIGVGNPVTPNYPTPISVICTGTVNVSNHPAGVPITTLTNGSYATVMAFKVKNNTNCPAQFWDSYFQKVSKTGSVPSEALELTIQGVTTLVGKNIWFRDHDYDFMNISYQGGTPTIIPPGQTRTFLLGYNMGNTVSQISWQANSNFRKDYFSVGLSAILFADANSPVGGTTFLQISGVSPTNNPVISPIWGPLLTINP